MLGLGTIINTGAIIIGGLLGVVFKKAMDEKLKKSLIIVLGASVMIIGIQGALEKMQALVSDNLLLSGGMLIMLLCLVIGTVIGELINIEKHFEKLGEWLKKKAKSEDDDSFMNGFLTASFTVCIGAMTVVGAINDGIYGDYRLLVVKAVLDFVFVMVMSSTLGKGCIFSAIPVFMIQFPITLLAFFIGDILNTNAINYLSLVGNVLIFCIGINLMFDRKIKVSNMLPSILLAIACGYIV